jgi:hypothetical protein
VPRIHAFEFEDLAWFPSVLRDAGTAYMRFAVERLGLARAMAKVVVRVLDESGETEIVDLCSGDGGPAVAVSRALVGQGRPVRVTLTDLYPSSAARARLAAADSALEYDPRPVDAADVPMDRPGLRTVFNAFHHFRPGAATRVLAGAVAANRPIVVGAMTQRCFLSLLGMLVVPLGVVLSVPFFRPFRWSWLLFTYVLPLIPLFLWWDGMVSVLRLYTADEMLAMASAADPEGAFEWRVEKVALGGPTIPGLALVGVPRAPRPSGD